MSGHSKWANIKNKKGKTDAARGNLFTKIGKELQIAVKAGGPNPDANSKLKDVIAKAKAANMPNDNIMRSIKRASGEGANEIIEEITYEGYGPAGIAIIAECATDNRNRTAAEVRHCPRHCSGPDTSSGLTRAKRSSKCFLLRGRMGFLLFLQNAVGDFAHQRFGHIVAKFDVVRHGVAGNIPAAVIE